MPSFLKQSHDQPLPGPGLYRFGSGQADIYVCLIGLADMLRQCLPEVEPDDYRTLKGRVFEAGSVRGDFLCGDEIRQLNSFKTLKKQVEWIGGRRALKTVVSKALPAAGGAGQITVAYEPRGAPYLVNNPGHSISISHAGKYALAGVCSNAHTRIGLDIERIRVQGFDHVMKVAFTDREIQAAGDRPEEACRIWTRKEAYLKFVKTGFRESLKRVDVSGATIMHGGVPVADLNTLTLSVRQQHLISIVHNQMKRACTQRGTSVSERIATGLPAAKTRR